MPKPWKKQIHKEVLTNKETEGVSLNESILLSAEIGGSPEIDLHGVKDVDAGLRELDGFLNQQFMNGVEGIKIIHGRGSGALRAAVHEYLSGLNFVEAYRDSTNPKELLGSTVVVLSKNYE